MHNFQAEPSGHGPVQWTRYGLGRPPTPLLPLPTPNIPLKKNLCEKKLSPRRLALAGLARVRFPSAQAVVCSLSTPVAPLQSHAGLWSHTLAGETRGWRSA